jgi:DNA topoisomerase-3
MTLSLAQALYEKHKLLTYPRTDSRALPQDYIATVRSAMEMLTGGKARKPIGLLAGYAPFAAQVLKEGWVRPNKRIFDDAKVSDHFAIIPTLATPRQLNEAETKLYDLVVKRFLAVFFPAAEFMVTTRITRVDGEPFRTDGRVMNNPGWLAVYGRESRTGDESVSLPALDGPKVRVERVDLRGSQTRPPARFTEATLLSAMEGAGKLIEDEDLREAMREKGLGTPATRAAVIEGLIFEDYLHRIGRELQPTPKAFSLMFALKHFGITEITSPELTGDWEHKLRQMEHGELKRRVFMDHIVDTTREMVERIRNGNIPDEAFATLKAPCPKCGATVQENYRKFQCQSCDFAIWRVMSGRELAPEEVEELIEKGVVGPLTGFRSRLGRPFAGALKLTAEMKAEFDFGHGAEGKEGGAEAPDFSGQEPLGACPKCGADVFEQPMAYLCEKSVGPERSCDFRSGRVILQRPIEREQMLKLLSTGRTDLLHRFISKKGRPFSAFLVRGADGKVGFQFAPRTGKRATAEPSKEPAKSSEKPLASTSVKSAAKVSRTASIAPTKTKATKKPPSPTRRKSAP